MEFALGWEKVGWQAISAMHQGAVSACYVSETERSVPATRDLSASSQRFFPRLGLCCGWNGIIILQRQNQR